MYARVSTIPGNHVKQVLEHLKNSSNEGLEEVKATYFLVDEKKEKTMTISLWETKEKAEASLPAAKKIFKELEELQDGRLNQNIMKLLCRNNHSRVDIYIMV